MVRLLMVDNYDSFTYNLVQALGALGAQLETLRNTEPDLLSRSRQVDGVVLSPGPGIPAEAGQLMALLADLERRGRGGPPVLGICLGHQAIAETLGGRLSQVEPVHGKAALVHHGGEGLLAGLGDPLEVGRYHSWAVTDTGDRYRATARTADGVVMAARATDLDWEGLQFHPESVLTPAGPSILEAFVRRCGG
jgi:anthranilate synthase/aminodeoxychorismate synthase-like glutamine amidotransferase